MDTIHIKDLEIFAFHGVLEEEKKLGQKFLLSLDLYIDLRPAGLEDNLFKTVNYAELCHKVEIFLKENTFDLIEKCAEETAKYILLNYELIKGVKVFIKKPWAPIGRSLDYAGVSIERFWHNVFIGIGSNMGDKKLNIDSAIEKINSSETKLIKTSSFYETKPVGYAEQDDFINCVLEIKTLLTPSELMKFLLEIEEFLKRERKERWGPRTIDLDILLYDDKILSDDETIIPHPRMHERLFVLVPLNEIAPNIIHPMLNKRIFELKNLLEKTQEL